MCVVCVVLCVVFVLCCCVLSGCVLCVVLCCVYVLCVCVVCVCVCDKLYVGRLMVGRTDGVEWLCVVSCVPQDKMELNSLVR